MSGQGSKGGGQVQQVLPTNFQRSPQGGQQMQTAPQTFNVNTAASNALQGAMGGVANAMSQPLNVSAYMNPYTQNVIDNTQNDIERQRQMTINNMGAAATRANAFGGSRQGVAEGVTNAEYGRIAERNRSNASAGLQHSHEQRYGRSCGACRLCRTARRSKQPSVQHGQNDQPRHDAARLATANASATTH